VSAGADWVVTGTITEEALTLDELRAHLTQMVEACAS